MTIDRECPWSRYIEAPIALYQSYTWGCLVTSYILGNQLEVVALLLCQSHKPMLHCFPRHIEHHLLGELPISSTLGPWPLLQACQIFVRNKFQVKKNAMMYYDKFGFNLIWKGNISLWNSSKRNTKGPLILFCIRDWLWSRRSLWIWFDLDQG